MTAKIETKARKRQDIEILGKDARQGRKPKRMSTLRESSNLALLIWNGASTKVFLIPYLTMVGIDRARRIRDYILPVARVWRDPRLSLEKRNWIFQIWNVAVDCEEFCDLVYTRSTSREGSTVCLDFLFSGVVEEVSDLPGWTWGI